MRVICVAWQQLSVGKHRAGEIFHLRDGLLQVRHHDELLKIIAPRQHQGGQGVGTGESPSGVELPAIRAQSAASRSARRSVTTRPACQRGGWRHPHYPDDAPWEVSIAEDR